MVIALATFHRFRNWLFSANFTIYSVTKSCLTLTRCDAIDWKPPGSSVYGILQAIILEWVTIPFVLVHSFSHVWLFGPHGRQHTRLPCPSPSSGACSNWCPLSWWCHPIISSSVVPFSTCLQSFPASGSFLMSQLFSSGGQGIGISASASVLPIKTQDWFPWELTGLISLQSQGLSRVFSNTTVQNINFLMFILLYGSTLTFINDHWKSHRFDYMELCQ